MRDKYFQYLQKTADSAMLVNTNRHYWLLQASYILIGAGLVAQLVDLLTTGRSAQFDEALKNVKEEK